MAAKVIKNSFAAKFFGLFHCDEIIILLAALHEKILAVDEVFGCNYTVEGCELLLVERYAAALYELAHLAIACENLAIAPALLLWGRGEVVELVYCLTFIFLSNDT